MRFMPRPRTAAVAGAVMSVGIVYFALLKSTTRSQEGDFFGPWPMEWWEMRAPARPSASVRLPVS